MKTKSFKKKQLCLFQSRLPFQILPESIALDASSVDQYKTNLYSMPSPILVFVTLYVFIAIVVANLWVDGRDSVGEHEQTANKAGR